MKRYVASIQCYTNSIYLDETNHTYYSDRSAAYFSKGSFTDALEDANACIKLNPDVAIGYYLKADALCSLKRHDDSTTACKDGLLRFPANDDLLRMNKYLERELESEWERAQHLLDSFPYNEDKKWLWQEHILTQKIVNHLCEQGFNAMVIHNIKAKATGKCRMKNIELKQVPVLTFTKGFQIYVAPKGVKFKVSSTGYVTNWCFGGCFNKKGNTVSFY